MNYSKIDFNKLYRSYFFDINNLGKINELLSEWISIGPTMKLDNIVQNKNYSYWMMSKFKEYPNYDLGNKNFTITNKLFAKRIIPKNIIQYVGQLDAIKLDISKQLNDRKHECEIFIEKIKEFDDPAAPQQDLYPEPKK